MSRRAAGKSAVAKRGDGQRETPANDAAGWRERVPIQPRRGNRGLLAASGLLLLIWLAVLAWLAFD